MGKSPVLLSFGHGYTAQTLARRLMAKDWRVVGTTRSEARAEAFTLNLDRSLLVLDTWFALQQLMQRHPV